MLAVEYVGNEGFRETERTPRLPGPGEVQIAVASVGICGTDLHVKRGRMSRRVPIPAPIGLLIATVATARGTNVLISEPNPGFDLFFQALDFGRCAPCAGDDKSIYGKFGVRYNV